EWLSAEVGKRQVRCEPQRAGESLEVDMMRTLNRKGYLFGPAQPRFAAHGDKGRAFDRLDDPDQLRRAKRAAELQEPRREIDHPEGACRSLKCCLENVCIRKVALCAALSTRRTDSESAAVFDVQECRKHRFGIKARKATPDDFPSLVHQCGNLAVAN